MQGDVKDPLGGDVTPLRAISTPMTAIPPMPSSFRAWVYLVGLSVQRQARVRTMTWVAVGLLLFAEMIVGIVTLADKWSLHNQQFRRLTPDQWADVAQVLTSLTGSGANVGIATAITGSFRAAMVHSDIFLFANAIVFNLFVSFLLPVWCLSFATEALGGEREGSNLVWLLTKPLSRPGIYLAKYVALVPWSLGFS
jgi:ABC-type transport system involved in multi-copper enzyme maturation permease subunit